MRLVLRLLLLAALLTGAAAGAAAAGFLEGSAVEQSVRHPGPIRQVVVEGRYLDVDVDGMAADGIAARAVVSGKLERRNDFALRIAVHEARASIGFTVNDRPLSAYSILWGPRLTIAAPRAAAVYVRTTTGDVLVTRLGTAARTTAVAVESAAGMVVVTDSAADVRLAAGTGDVIVRRVAGDVQVATVSGDITVTDSRGDVRAHTTAGRQRFADVDGVVTVSSRENVSVSGSVGDVRAAPPGAPGTPALPAWGADTPWRRR